MECFRMLVPLEAWRPLLRGILDLSLQTMTFGGGTQKLGRGGHRTNIYMGTINGSKWAGSRDTPSPWSIFFNFMQFSGDNGQNNRLAHPQGLVPLSGKSWIRLWPHPVLE